MSKRKIHKRPNTVINLGKTRTACGQTLYGAPADTSGAVVEFGTVARRIEATIHATLVTCKSCLKNSA